MGDVLELMGLLIMAIIGMALLSKGQSKEE
jgi:hypothetical protein